MKQKVTWIVISLIVILGVAIGARFFMKQGNTTGTSGGNNYGKKVSVYYVGSFEDGVVFDTNKQDVAEKNGLSSPKSTYKTLDFVVGSGDLVPGFEDAVKDMKKGETKHVVLQPAQAYGERDDKNIQEIGRDLFQQSGIIPEVGATYMIGNAPVKVTALTDTGVTVDLNHPMAGKVLVFDITLDSVQ